LRRNNIKEKYIDNILIIILLLLLQTPFAMSVPDDGRHATVLSEGSIAPAANDFDSPQNYSYEEIDRHATNAPSSVETSVKSLADYLVAPAKNDREKARAIFRWIAENIDYDVAGYFSGSFGSMNSEDLLKSRKSVCEGYSDLFQSLAAEAGLTAVRISGYGKGYSYRPGDKFSGPSNHAWNAVRINGSWYLIDCTWGAGFVDDNGKFVREFDAHYFMTPPSEFVYDHLPEASSWQLLSKPLSKSEFEQLVHVKARFFNYGLEIGSPAQATFEAKGEANVSIYAPEDVLLTASLEQARDDPSSTGTKLDGLTFAERDNARYDIRALFPEKGSYILRVYAKKRSEPGEYHEVAEYGIDSTAGVGESAGFPYTFGKFSEVGAYLSSPMEGRLRSGEDYSFRLRVSGAKNVTVVNGENWNGLEPHGDWFEGRVTPESGDVLVVANFGGDSYDGLLKYTAG